MKRLVTLWRIMRLSAHTPVWFPLMFAVLALQAPWLWAAEEQDGVAVAIVFDTSGSMADAVKDANGAKTPKYKIASRSLQAVASQLEAFAKSQPEKKIQAGLYVFTQTGAKEAVKFGPLNTQAITNWLRQYSGPDGGTPLGASLSVAGEALFKSGLTRKHILVITDGMNTVGNAPEKVMPRLVAKAAKANTSLSFHFVAFDVDDKVFAPVKKLGATVVAAADEKQLNMQLDFILQKKILLENEEPAKK